MGRVAAGRRTLEAPANPMMQMRREVLPSLKCHVSSVTNSRSPSTSSDMEELTSRRMARSIAHGLAGERGGGGAAGGGAHVTLRDCPHLFALGLEGSSHRRRIPFEFVE